MIKRMILMLAVTGAVLAALGFMKFRQIQEGMAQAQAFQPPPEAVTTVVATEEKWPSTLSAIGSVASVQGVTVSADLPGIIGRIAFQSGVAIYGGYFGAGIGIMMLAGLGLLGLRDVNRMNALKSVLALLCNVASVIYFIACGSVDWRLAGWLIAGSIPGYFLGAHFAQKIPAIAVRLLVAAIGLGIAARLFWKQMA